MSESIESAESPASAPIPASAPLAGKALILATKPFASDNAAVSWAHIVSTAALLLAALAGTLWNVHWTAKVACSVLEALLLLRMFVIYHDQQHHAILPKSRLAEGLMRVFGIVILSPSSIWRSSHDHHHKHNSKIKGSHIGSYPVMTKDNYAKSSRPERVLYLFMRHPLTILFGYLFVFLFGMCLRPFASKPREHADCLAALAVHLGIAAALVHFFGWGAWLLAQVVPHLLSSAIGSYLFYAQHNFPTVSFYDKEGWTYEKAALDSSSYLKTGPVMAWFTGNIGYHHIHHLNARIPFYRLPEVMRSLPELQAPKTTSLHPLDIARCLRLKVWDVAAQRMVGL